MKQPHSTPQCSICLPPRLANCLPAPCLPLPLHPLQEYAGYDFDADKIYVETASGRFLPVLVGTSPDLRAKLPRGADQLARAVSLGHARFIFNPLSVSRAMPGAPVEGRQALGTALPACFPALPPPAHCPCAPYCALQGTKEEVAAAMLSYSAGFATLLRSPDLPPTQQRDAVRTMLEQVRSLAGPGEAPGEARPRARRRARRVSPMVPPSTLKCLKCVFFLSCLINQVVYPAAKEFGEERGRDKAIPGLPASADEAWDLATAYTAGDCASWREESTKTVDKLKAAEAKNALVGGGRGLAGWPGGAGMQPLRALQPPNPRGQPSMCVPPLPPLPP